MHNKTENKGANFSLYSDGNPYVSEKIQYSFSAQSDHLVAQESLVPPSKISGQELNGDKIDKITYEYTGIIVAILGLIVAFLGLAYEIHRRLKDQENERISKIKSSFIETKGDILRIRNLMESSLDYNAINSTIGMIASEKVIPLLPKLEDENKPKLEDENKPKLEDENKLKKYQSDLIDFFEDEDKMQYIRSAITSEIRKTHVRKELLPDFNKIRSMLSPYEADMPLTVSIISDIIDMIEFLSKSYMSVRWSDLLYTDRQSSKEFRKILGDKPFDELANFDVNVYISNRIFDDLDNAREKNIKPVYGAGYDILTYVVEIIAGLSNKEIKKLQAWDDNPPPDEYHSMIRMSLAWEKLIQGLHDKVLKKRFYFSNDRFEELRLQHTLEEVRIAIRFIIDSGHYADNLDKQKIHDYLKKYPHLKEILA